MTRGTTPLHTFTLPKDVSEYSNFIITYRQNSGTVLEKKPEQCLVEGKEIKVRLTQEETLLFDSGQKAFVQIRVINEEGVAEASGVFSFPVNSVLNETILQDGEIPDYATSQDILYGKVAYAGGIKLTGEIEVRAASDELITEKGQVEIFPSGYYSEQNTVRIDPTEQAKIIPENIVETANILGVQGTAHPCEEFDDENRTARVAFSDETVLEISQQGSGVKGLNGNTDGLYAKNINTGEDTASVIYEQGETITEQTEQITELGEQIDTLTAANEELQEANAELTERVEELSNNPKVYPLNDNTEYTMLIRGIPSGGLCVFPDAQIGQYADSSYNVQFLTMEYSTITGGTYRVDFSVLKYTGKAQQVQIAMYVPDTVTDAVISGLYTGWTARREFRAPANNMRRLLIIIDIAADAVLPAGNAYMLYVDLS